jgi:hypothetical protein
MAGCHLLAKCNHTGILGDQGFPRLQGLKIVCLRVIEPPQRCQDTAQADLAASQFLAITRRRGKVLAELFQNGLALLIMLGRFRISRRGGQQRCEIRMGHRQRLAIGRKGWIIAGQFFANFQGSMQKLVRLA